MNLQPTMPQRRPTAASTSGYRQLIFALHVRQRPRSAIQLTSGRFSHHANSLPQLRQCERGFTTLSPSGQRLRHTFRKLPKASPSSAARIVPKSLIIGEVEYTSVKTQGEIPPPGLSRLGIEILSIPLSPAGLH